MSVKFLDLFPTWSVQEFENIYTVRTVTSGFSYFLNIFEFEIQYILEIFESV